jgi:CRISPR/Cas system-associated protein Cas10 (large subunit of type III CRISPR-Cas system)
MTEEPETIETGIDVYDFQIREEMEKEPKSKMENLEESFRMQIMGELNGHKKSPFFHVPKDLSSIRFFDQTEPLQKLSRTRLGMKNVIRKTMKEMQVSIHSSTFKLSQSKKLSKNHVEKRNKSRMTLHYRDTNENIYHGNFGSGNITLNGTETCSELMDHIDTEMKKFEINLNGEQMDLVVSKEEFQVKLTSWCAIPNSLNI